MSDIWPTGGGPLIRLCVVKEDNTIVNNIPKKNNLNINNILSKRNINIRTNRMIRQTYNKPVNIISDNNETVNIQFNDSTLLDSIKDLNIKKITKLKK